MHKASVVCEFRGRKLPRVDLIRYGPVWFPALPPSQASIVHVGPVWFPVRALSQAPANQAGGAQAWICGQAPVAQQTKQTLQGWSYTRP